MKFRCIWRCSGRSACRNGESGPRSARTGDFSRLHRHRVVAVDVGGLHAHFHGSLLGLDKFVPLLFMAQLRGRPLVPLFDALGQERVVAIDELLETILFGP